jgi:plasmid stabilization system protein ParE
MRKIRLHSEAEQELLDAEQWYRERSDVAAQAFSLEIAHALQTIAEGPLVWPLGKRGERRFVLNRFPYTVLYRVKNDEIFVTAVAHHSRRPGYWRRRT